MPFSIEEFLCFTFNFTKDLPIFLESQTCNNMINETFIVDTVCVEFRFANGRMISIDYTVVENEVVDNMYQWS